MRVELFGGPMHGERGRQRDFTPALTVLGSDEYDQSFLWNQIMDAVLPPPEKIGLYVPWIAWYDKAIFSWAGTMAEPTARGRRWFFWFPREGKEPVNPQVEKDLLYMRLQNDVVWLRSFPTDL